MNNLKIKINGREVQSTENINAYNLDGGLDLGRSIESCGIISEEAFEKSCEGFGDDVRQDGLIIAIIKKFKELKDWIVAKFKALVGFIRNLIDRVFHRSKIKDIELSDDVTNEDIQQKNKRIDEYNKHHENKMEHVVPSSNLLKIVYEDFAHKTTSAVIDISTYKQYAVLQNIKCIPIFIEPSKFRASADRLQTTLELAMKPGNAVNSNVISDIQKFKKEIFDGNVSDDNIKYRFIEFAKAFKDLKSLENMTTVGTDLGKRIDEFINEFQSGSGPERLNRSESAQKSYKVMNLFASLVTSYTSAYVRIVMEITRLVETEARLYINMQPLAFRNMTDSFKVQRMSNDSYTINIKKSTLSKNQFSPEELKALIESVDLINDYTNSYKTETWKYPELSKAYTTAIRIFSSKSNQVKSIVGKITKDTAFTAYDFNIEHDSDEITMQGRIVIDNRKRIDIGYSNLYHSSDANLTEISTTSAAADGMKGTGRYSQAIATFGNKFRMYASKYPVIKNGIPLTNEAMAKFIKMVSPNLNNFSMKTVSPNDIKSFFDNSGLTGMYIYEIDHSELIGAAIYADPEHNGAMQRITNKLVAGGEVIKDNCVYVESDKPIKVSSKHKFEEYVDYKEVYNLLRKDLNKYSSDKINFV